MPLQGFPKCQRICLTPVTSRTRIQRHFSCLVALNTGNSSFPVQATSILSDCGFCGKDSESAGPSARQGPSWGPTHRVVQRRGLLCSPDYIQHAAQQIVGQHIQHAALHSSQAAVRIDAHNL